MFEGKNMTFVRLDRVSGTSAKSGNPYDFATLTLSDGIESFKVDVRLEVASDQFVQGIRKGEKVNVDLEVYENFGKTAFRVSSLKMAVAQKVG